MNSKLSNFFSHPVLFPTSARLNNRRAVSHSATFNGRNITILPNDLLLNIFSKLDCTTISSIKCVNKRFYSVIKHFNLERETYYSLYCLLPYNSVSTLNTRSMLDSLMHFSKKSMKRACELTECLEKKQFHKMLFFSMAEALNQTKSFFCEHLHTFRHLNHFTLHESELNANGKCLVTIHRNIPIDNYLDLTICELDDDNRWQEAAHITDTIGRFCLSDFTISPDGRCIVIANSPNQSSLIIFERGDNGWSQHGHRLIHQAIDNVVFHPSGCYLGTVSQQGVVTIWKRGNGQMNVVFSVGKSSESHCTAGLAFSPDGQWLFTATQDRTANFFKLKDNQWALKHTLINFAPGWEVNFSPDSQWLLVKSLSYSLVMSLSNVLNTASISLDPEHINWKGGTCDVGYAERAHFSAAGTRLAIWKRTESTSQTLIWKLVNGNWKYELTIDNTYLSKFNCFSPEGRHLIINRSHGTPEIWGQYRGKWRIKYSLDPCLHNNVPVQSGFFSPGSGGHCFITIPYKGHIKVWRLRGEKRIH